MSFSSNIKEELSRNETGARHCKIAEIAGFLRFGGNISLEPEHYEIQIQTETVSAAKRFYKLIKDVFDIHAKIDVGRNEFLKRYRSHRFSGVIQRVRKDGNVRYCLSNLQEWLLYVD